MRKIITAALLAAALLFSVALAEGLMISEVLSGNPGDSIPGIPRYADAVRLTNTGRESLNPEGWQLSDSRKQKNRYTLPAAELAPGESMVIPCASDGGKGVAPFGISSKGERIYLFDPSGETRDSLAVPALPPGVSYGRGDGGRLMYFSSFGGEGFRKDGRERIAEKPVLSAPSGFYREPLRVTLSGEAPIYYTLDGSVPTEASSLYTEPIEVRDTTQLRAVSAPAGAIPSQAVTAVYRFDGEAFALEALTVTVPAEGLAKLARNTTDRDLEVPAHVTCFSGEGGTLFDLDCGLAYSGQSSRRKAHHGWKLTFRGRFGADELRARVFPDSGQESFTSLLLRVGTVDRNPLRDLLGAAIGQDTMPAVLRQHRRAVVLYINREYWGVYYLRENVNAEFAAAQLGGDKDDVDIIYRGDVVRRGDGKDWKELLKYCETHHLSDPECYAWVTERVNPESFMDYYIWRPYTADHDSSNIQIVRSRSAKDPRWHLVIYDLDWAFQQSDADLISMGYYTYRLQSARDNQNRIIASLLQNETFRKAFLERFAWHMKHTFAPERLLGLLEKERELVLAEMPESLERWGYSAAAWEKDLQNVRDFIRTEHHDRRTLLIRETVRYFGLPKEEEERLFGGI